MSQMVLELAPEAMPLLVYGPDAPLFDPVPYGESVGFALEPVLWLEVYVEPGAPATPLRELTSYAMDI